VQVLNSRPKGKTLAGPPDVGFGGRKAPSSMGKIGTAEVLRLRAPSAVSRDKAVRRFAQDDAFVVSWRCKKSVFSDLSSARQVSDSGTSVLG
jgi:hypothetical protein